MCFLFIVYGFRVAFLVDWLTHHRMVQHGPTWSNRTTTDTIILTDIQNISKFRIGISNIKIYQDRKFGNGSRPSITILLHIITIFGGTSWNKHPQISYFGWPSGYSITGDSLRVIACHRLSRSTSLWRSRFRVSNCSASSLDPVDWNITLW